MGVTRTAPWWLTWALLAGLVAVFAGERVLETIVPARLVLSGLGVLVVLGCLGWRTLSRSTATGDAERVERLLLAAYAGCMLALVLYLVSSDDGMRWLGIDFAGDEAQERYELVLHVLWPILLAASLLPALGAQLAIGSHRHARRAGAGLEALRVTGTARSALAIALAGALLFVVGWIGSARDKTLDVSYFRTSSPGSATLAMVEGLREPLRVTLFFPDVNPVKDEVLGYFRALAGADERVAIETHDRMAAPELAEQHRVTQDGTVLLASAQGEERIVLGTELADARPELRTLDRSVQERLMMLLRERRTVYLTTGHGELNDSASAGPLAGERLGGTEALGQLLQLLNYQVRDLGLASGLGQAVPDDAAMVMVLGPRRPFLPAELTALDRYLAGGGSLLVALDPEGEFSLGRLEQRLGVRFVSELLADDQQHLRQRGNPSDRRLIVARRFSSHAAVTTLSRGGFRAAVLFVGAGHLEPTAGGAAGQGAVPVAAAPMPPAESPTQVATARADAAGNASPERAPRPSFIVHSLPSTFADLDADFTFDEGAEERRPYNLVAAVEGETGRGGAAEPGSPPLVKAANVAAEAAGGGPDEGAPAGEGDARGGGAADRPGAPESAETDEAAAGAAPTRDAAAAAEPESTATGTASEATAPDSEAAAPGSEAAAPGSEAAAQDSTTAGPPMRALVYADAGLFTDAVIGALGLNAALVADGIKWLGGEEALAGVAESEEDVPIVHTNAEDVIWFYSTILGAPALLLALGLFTAYRRRRSGGVPA